MWEGLSGYTFVWETFQGGVSVANKDKIRVFGSAPLFQPGRSVSREA
jgi:hypothetical protein